jgi:2-polyprenyl-3-methyl-5-hydroxy-6-metoxy-1,4-benzoquinol methylase
MRDREREDTRALWNRVADDWHMHVGDDGDGNRLLNSDPVQWAVAGDVHGRTVLDAGCGTGYVSKQRHDRDAVVTGIDGAERMMAIAGGRHGEIDVRVDHCAARPTIEDAYSDLVMSNDGLMDTPDLPARVRQQAAERPVPFIFDRRSIRCRSASHC